MKRLSLPQIIFCICLTVSICLCIAGFWLPPQGIIDGSVLTAVGELLGFATVAQIPLLLTRHSFEISHGNTKVTVGETLEDN